MPVYQRNYNFYDDAVSDQICDDGMFSYFANSFLIVTGDEHIQQYYERYNRLKKEMHQVKTGIFEKGNKNYI